MGLSLALARIVPPKAKKRPAGWKPKPAAARVVPPKAEKRPAGWSPKPGTSQMTSTKPAKKDNRAEQIPGLRLAAGNSRE